MPSSGELLREERMKQNRSLSDIATATCICTRYLEAIENDKPDILPGNFFYRSFLKQYAVELRLDERAQQAVMDAARTVEEVDPVPALAVAHDAARKARWRPYKPRTAVSLMFLIAVLTGCSALYAIWNQALANSEAIAGPDASAVIPVQTEPSGQSSKSRSVGGIKVDLAATEATWVSLSSDGKLVFSGVLDASQTKEFAIGEQARLLTENAAGLDVRWNGKRIGPIGPRGEARIVQFTPHNFEIVTPGRM